MSEKALIRFENVDKTYTVGSLFNKKNIHAVKNANLNINKGEILGVVGESGCGKTTLAKLLTNILDISGGELYVNDIDISKMGKAERKKFRSEVQMIFQDPFGSLNPAHRISYIVGRTIGIYNPQFTAVQIREKVKDLFTIVGLTPPEDFMDKHPNQISGGQRQRIVIARALAVEPEIIVADEPTSMLDVSIGIEIMNLMLELKEKKQLTYMLITHNLASARYMADRIVVMYGGTLVEESPTDELLENPYHPYTILLLESTPEPYKKDKKAIEAKEDPANLADPSPRCMFYKRCPYAMEKCRKEEPNWYQNGKHRVKCFLYENIDGPTESLVNIDVYVKKETEAIDY
ncbi:ABC transporter ATP-binding protein [Vallitalea pronyensis]|uniref:ABC transporter ATP-binding protein n=1 Tax=Vallitalea pronyensis TaxID=1348613 RepID=A0A8J8SIU0_9FIRM|nr:ABC transporter ATP-binding protein [Vallitalea pronyensis]QUI24794.1 ABC transporter ATP-binding protein [Vallitalea pronyensis]